MLKSKDKQVIQSNSKVLYCEAEVTFEAAQAVGTESGTPKFRMVANTGAPMEIGGFRYPVVIDLMKLKIPARPVPVRAYHDAREGVGHTTSVVVEDGRRLIAEGVISRETGTAQEIIASAGKGFPWQASVGVSITKMDNHESETVIEVNGRRMKGPIHVVREGVLSELSFVDLGADHRTSVRVMASHQEEGEFMSAKNDGQLDEQMVEAGEQVAAGSPPKKVEAAAPAPVKVEAAIDDPVATEREKAIGQLRAQVSDEMKRVDAIKTLCAGSDLFPVAEKAIREGWSTQRTELEVLRTERPKIKAAAVHLRDQFVTGKVLEAACLEAAKVPGLTASYGEQVMEAAHRRFHNGIGLQEMLLEAAWANGYTGRSFKTDSREALRYAFNRGIQAAAGISTIDIGGILGNVANKFLLDGFNSVETVWRQITSIRNVSDFKTVTSYRLVGQDQYEKVAPGGEIKHGTLGEQSFTNKAETYGLMLTIDRRDLINDDLGAITTVPRKLGRGSGLKINDVFWTEFMANSSFFVSGNKNYQEGAAGLSVLGLDGLTAGELLFMNQTDPDGKPIGIMPKFLLVPTALSAVAAQLFRSLEMRDTTATTKFPIANPHAGKFPVVVSRYLGNTAYTGNSITGWYLLADPADLPVIETAFLNGQESPTIESSEADFNTLGVSMRGFHDFGVAKQDPRGGMKSKGAA